MRDPDAASSGSRWSTIAIDGHACELHEPPGAAPGRALIYLHDVGGEPLRGCDTLRNLIEAAGLPAIAPQAGRSWWLDRIIPTFDARITPERFIVDSVRGELARRFGVHPPGIAVIGTGMGGQGALRIAYRHPAVFPTAAAIAPAIDFHVAMRDSGFDEDGAWLDTLWETFGDAERARQDTAILHVHPLNWPRQQFFASDPADRRWHDGAVRLHSKLNALGIPHTALLEPRGDVDAAAEAMRFVLEALDREARRIT
jgi:pimeloyl-ACP methyl ester carboxylesterase